MVLQRKTNVMNDERKKCSICHDLFVGPVSDDPICDACFYEAQCKCCGIAFVPGVSGWKTEYCSKHCYNVETDERPIQP